MLDPKTQKQILELKNNYSVYATWADKKFFKLIVEALAEPFKNSGIDKVLGIESRGFILGGAVAYVLGAGFVVARKKGKMYTHYEGDDIYSISTPDYSGKVKTLEIEKNDKAINKEDNILIVDDWFETGGQGHAVIRLIEKAGGKVVGISVMLDEMTLEVKKSFEPYNINTLVKITD